MGGGVDTAAYLAERRMREEGFGSADFYEWWDRDLVDLIWLREAVFAEIERRFQLEDRGAESGRP